MEKIFVNSHASICINGDIYVDPFEIVGAPGNARAVFITHSHFDHFSPDDIKKVSNENTRVYHAGDVLPDYAESFPAYNINKFRSDGVPFHPKSSESVGYLLTIDGVRYTICGDTDFTPELSKVKCDVLFVPIGGTYTMTAKEAAKCANALKPKLVVPVHYGKIVGDKNDEKTFVENLDKGILYKTFF